jgi:hypothetical protein
VGIRNHADPRRHESAGARPGEGAGTSGFSLLRSDDFHFCGCT